MAKRSAADRLSAIDQRLSAEIKLLRMDIDALRQRHEELANELRVQFIRIAEIQAALDAQRLAETSSAPPTPHK